MRSKPPRERKNPAISSLLRLVILSREEHENCTYRRRAILGYFARAGAVPMDLASFNFSRAALMVRYSVLIPARDSTHVVGWLTDELDQILGELLLPYEIICVDDGSALAEVDALEALLRRHPALRVLRFDQQRGISAALSAGIAAAARRSGDCRRCEHEAGHAIRTAFDCAAFAVRPGRRSIRAVARR